MKRLLLLMASATLCACGQSPGSQPTTSAEPALPSSQSDGLQPGLWETSTVDETAGGASDVARVCVGEDAEGSPENGLDQFDDPACTVTRSTGLAGATTHAECLKDGVRFVTDATMATRRTSYTFSLTTRATLPAGGVHESRITAKGRRIGPCPAGMSPGDTDAD